MNTFNLTIGPAVWQKLRFLQGLKPVEISGYGETVDGQPLHLVDFHLVEQESTVATTDMTAAGIRDYFNEMAQMNKAPHNFGRIWIHTHPMPSPRPSGQDRKTFEELFRTSSWGIMAIVGSTGETYAEMSLLKEGFGRVSFEIPWTVVFDRPSREVTEQDLDNWADDHDVFVEEPQVVFWEPPKQSKKDKKSNGDKSNGQGCIIWEEDRDKWDDANWLDKRETQTANQETPPVNVGGLLYLSSEELAAYEQQGLVVKREAGAHELTDKEWLEQELAGAPSDCPDPFIGPPNQAVKAEAGVKKTSKKGKKVVN